MSLLLSFFFTFSILNSVCAVTNKEELYNWFERVSDQKFQCAPSNNVEANGLQILKIVECSDPLAIYRYDVKVQ